MSEAVSEQEEPTGDVATLSLYHGPDVPAAATHDASNSDTNDDSDDGNEADVSASEAQSGDTSAAGDEHHTSQSAALPATRRELGQKERKDVRPAADGGVLAQPHSDTRQASRTEAEGGDGEEAAALEAAERETSAATTGTSEAALDGDAPAVDTQAELSLEGEQDRTPTETALDTALDTASDPEAGHYKRNAAVSQDDTTDASDASDTTDTMETIETGRTLTAPTLSADDVSAPTTDTAPTTAQGVVDSETAEQQEPAAMDADAMSGKRDPAGVKHGSISSENGDSIDTATLKVAAEQSSDCLSDSEEVDGDNASLA